MAGTIPRARFAIRSTVWDAARAAKKKDAPWIVKPWGHLSTRKRQRQALRKDA